MNNVYRLLLVLTLFGGSAAAWILPGAGAANTAATVAAPGHRRQAIEVIERRLEEDPRSALDMAQLAALFVEEGRMSGDDRLFVRAESLARRSLGERRRKNGRSAALLVNALHAQHRFAEGLEVARDLVESEPDEPAYRALLAEALMEVGDYDDAIGQLGAVRAHREDLGIAPRFARWAEVTGQVGEARRILRAACAEAEARVDLSGERRAWFNLRLADLELRHGNLRGAAAAIDEGLRSSPGDWRLILARGRLEAAKESWGRAARSAEEVIAVVPSPDALALLAIARGRLGIADEAEALEAALEGVALRSGAIHRTWALALLDRGRRVGAIVALASADTLGRRDIHTLDLLAWALHRSGRSVEALPLIRRAVLPGSAEPTLRYHAAMIELAAGDPAVARRHAKLALGRRRALTVEQVASVRHVERSGAGS